ncbi:Protein GPA-13 a [Aphelenchoides avenae]|nr:Protein GPA-13 a [Aphelenchus avenae]
MGSLCSRASDKVKPDTANVEANGDGEAKKPPLEEAPNQESLDLGDAERNFRLLMLGIYESGKTTVLEQIRKLAKQDPSESELLHRKSFIYDMLFTSMKSIIEYMQETGGEFAEAKNQENVDIILAERPSGRALTEQEYNAFKSLWSDKTVREYYARRTEFRLNDSTKYFFDSLDRVYDEGFKPVVDDLVMAYVPTIGVQNVIFTSNKRTFQLFDVGGQIVDRKKWATIYDGLDAIFFCIAISEYDQLVEGSETGLTRLEHSFNLLEEVSNEAKFASLPIFVFLNETDIFREKLERFPLEKTYPKYDGESEDDAMEFIKELTTERCKGHDSKLVHIHFTCAINSKDMAKLLNSVFKIIAKDSK